MSKQSTNKINIASRPAPAADRDTVEAMAYQLWLQRGCPIGSDQQDWYRAEADLKSTKHANQRAA